MVNKTKKVQAGRIISVTQKELKTNTTLDVLFAQARRISIL